MDVEKIEKLFDLGTKYLSEYIFVFVSTLRFSNVILEPIPVYPASPSIILPKSLSNSYFGKALNPKLIGFLIISFCIGSTFNSIIPRRLSAPDFLTMFIVTISVWLTYSLTLYWSCQSFGRYVDLGETLSVSLQLVAVLYVVSNFITLIWGSLTEVPLLKSLVSYQFAAPYINQPIYAYFLIQGLLLLGYFPASLKKMYGLSFGHIVLVGATILLWMILGYTIFIATHIIPLWDTSFWDTHRPMSKFYIDNLTNDGVQVEIDGMGTRTLGLGKETWDIPEGTYHVSFIAKCGSTTLTVELPQPHPPHTLICSGSNTTQPIPLPPAVRNTEKQPDSDLYKEPNKPAISRPYPGPLQNPYAVQFPVPRVLNHIPHHKTIDHNNPPIRRDILHHLHLDLDSENLVSIQCFDSLPFRC